MTADEIRRGPSIQMHGLLTLPYVYEELTAEVVDVLKQRSGRFNETGDYVGQARRGGKELAFRAIAIEQGSCPPWRTDPSIPAGYDGVHFGLAIRVVPRVRVPFSSPPAEPRGVNTSRRTPRGDIVEGVPCPRCRGEIVYNGNYFCDRLDSGTCSWALGPNDTPFARRLLTQYRSQRGDLGDERWPSL